MIYQSMRILTLSTLVPFFYVSDERLTSYHGKTKIIDRIQQVMVKTRF